MNKGFTLIEVIIVICIILFLLVIIWPVGISFYQQQLLNKSQQEIIWFLKQARSDAVNQKNNSAFGVQLQAGRAILFQGATFEDRDQTADISQALPSVVSFSGLKTVVFGPNTGFVEQPGKITMSLNNSVKEISINQLGIIDY